MNTIAHTSTTTAGPNGVHPHALPLVITQGDPAGIGPEILLKALQQRPDLLPRLLVAGDLPPDFWATVCHR